MDNIRAAIDEMNCTVGISRDERRRVKKEICVMVKDHLSPLLKKSNGEITQEILDIADELYPIHNVRHLAEFLGYPEISDLRMDLKRLRPCKCPVCGYQFAKLLKPNKCPGVVHEGEYREHCYLCSVRARRLGSKGARLMPPLSPQQAYILDFMVLGNQIATIAGNRIQISHVDKGPASIIYALERKGLVEQFWSEGTTEYRTHSHFRYYRATQKAIDQYGEEETA